jgi:hypothetical protein
MRKKNLMISIAVVLIGLFIGLSRVMTAQEPESASDASAQEASTDVAVDTQVGRQRRHVLGDGVADTPLEVDTLYLRNNLTGGPLETYAGE